MTQSLHFLAGRVVQNHSLQVAVEVEFDLADFMFHLVQLVTLEILLALVVLEGAHPPVVKTEIEVFRIVQVLDARHRDVLQAFHVSFLELLELGVRWELVVQFPHQLLPSDFVIYFFFNHADAKFVQDENRSRLSELRRNKRLRFRSNYHEL